MAEREKYPLRPGFKRNNGEKPRTKAEQVEVALMNGEIAGRWTVKTTRWSLTGWWMDVDQYRIA